MKIKFIKLKQNIEDLEEVFKFKNILLEKIKGSKLDLCLSFNDSLNIHSKVISVIILAYKILKEDNRHFYIVCSNQKFLKLMDQLYISSIINILDSKEELKILLNQTHSKMA